jgi:hypothetical protein
VIQLDPANFSGTTSDACGTAKKSSRDLIAKFVAQLGLHFSGDGVLGRYSLVLFTHREQVGGEDALCGLAAGFPRDSEEVAVLENTHMYRDFVKGCGLTLQYETLAGFCVTRWRDASKFIQHFVALAPATIMFQNAPHKTKPAPMLAPSSFVPFAPQDFAFMTALRKPMERIEKLIVDLERTWRDPTAQRLEKSDGIFVAMQHMSDLVTEVSKEFELESFRDASQILRNDLHDRLLAGSGC